MMSTAANQTAATGTMVNGPATGGRGPRARQRQAGPQTGVSVAAAAGRRAGNQGPDLRGGP